MPEKFAQFAGIAICATQKSSPLKLCGSVAIQLPGMRMASMAPCFKPMARSTACDIWHAQNSIKKALCKKCRELAQHATCIHVRTGA